MYGYGCHSFIFQILWNCMLYEKYIICRQDYLWFYTKTWQFKRSIIDHFKDARGWNRFLLLEVDVMVVTNCNAACLIWLTQFWWILPGGNLWKSVSMLCQNLLGLKSTGELLPSTHYPEALWLNYFASLHWRWFRDHIWVGPFNIIILHTTY